MSQTITVSTIINSPIEKVWDTWNNPEHITKWYFASDDWECPTAVNDLRTGGTFVYRMQAKENSLQAGAGFDMGGIYTEIIPLQRISYTMNGEDKRKVIVIFETTDDNQTKVTETFDMENVNSEELQRGGWQAILENFKKQAELAA